MVPSWSRAQACGCVMVKVTAQAADGPEAKAARLLAQAAVEGTAPTPVLIAAAEMVPPPHLSRCAVAAAERGHHRIAALLLAILSRRDPSCFARVFGRVVTSGHALRAFVGAMRSGQAGRQSLGTRPKAMVRDWIDRATEAELLAASVGKDPSLADILRMVHPKPASAQRAALYRWLLGDRSDDPALPPVIRALQAFRAAPVGDPPDVPVDLLTGLKLHPAQWAAVARRLPLAEVLHRLHFLLRRGAFDDPAALSDISARLRDAAQLRAAGLGPYRLLCLFRALDPAAPPDLHAALAAALETAAGMVQPVAGRVALCLDTSGAMVRRATDRPRGAETAVRCHDVAALMLSVLMRDNRAARLVPYAEAVTPLALTPDMGIPLIAKRLAAVGGTASRCTVPLDWLRAQKKPVDLVVIVTANALWGSWYGREQPGAEAAAWQRIKAHNPQARLVCLQIRPDIPRDTAITLPDGPDVLHLSGFSDAMFDRIGDFLDGRSAEDYWERVIAAVD